MLKYAFIELIAIQSIKLESVELLNSITNSQS